MKLITKVLLTQFFLLFLYVGYLSNHAMDESLPKNPKEYYTKYLKGKGYRTSYNESVGDLAYEQLGPFIQKEIKTEFRRWKEKQTRKDTHEEEEKGVDLVKPEEIGSEEKKEVKKSKLEKKKVKKEIISIIPEEEIREEKKEALITDEIASQLNNDKEFLKTIAATIMNRMQTQVAIMEETTAKHGPESFEIWKKLPYGLSWGDKKNKLDQQEKETLERLFGDLDKAKMKINREDFILAKKVILNDPVAKARNVCKQGAIELVEDFKMNAKRPHSIICKSSESQVTGVLYIKNEENQIAEENMNKIYVAINISDIVDKIKSSKKQVWNKKKMDWDQAHDGRMTTITPTLH